MGFLLIIFAISSTVVASEVDNISSSTVNISSVNNSIQVTQNAYSDSASPPSTTTRIIFIHHSSGGNWLATGNGNLGSSLNSNNYYVSESDYGWDAQPNDNLGDHTDTPDWPSWFNDVKMPYVYNSNYHSAYSNNIANPGGENEIIMFKSCFPLSEVGSSIDDEKAIYNSLLPYFAAHQNKLFVLITPPGETQVSSYQLTRDLCNWLTDTQNGWLKGYSGNNVFAFDFYCVLSEVNSHHRWAGDHIEHVYAADYDGISPYHNGDDHPNAIGNQKASSEFVPLLNVMYNRWKNNVTTITVSANPVGGTYNTSQTITLTSTNGTSIYYSTDNSDPRTSATRKAYSTPISISNTTTLKFAACDSLNNWSQVYSQTYTIKTVFTNDQVIQAAKDVRNYIDANHALPDKVTINGKQLNMYSFLYLLSFAVQNLYNKNSNLMSVMNFNGPQIEKEDIHTGSMGVSEYIHIADIVKSYMDKTNYVPGYAYGTSLGTYFGWKSMIYMYCNVLANYNNNTKILPSSISVKPWKVVSDTNAATFTSNQVIDAAGAVKNYIDNNHALPNYVTINGKQIGMYSFLHLLSFAVQNIYNHNNSTLDTWTFKGPEIEKEDIRTGNMGVSEYIHIADIVKVYMDKTGYVPGYSYGTSFGTYFGWKSMIYMYSNILVNYNSTRTALPSSIAVKPWKVVSDTNAITATNDQVVTAAIWVKNYLDTNHALPNNVTVNGKQIGMYSFLYLLSFAVQNIYNHNNSTLDTWTFNGPEIQKEDIHGGNMGVSEYIHIADIVKVYMDKTGYVPGYAYGTSLGTYFGWKSMIYMYSSVLVNYNTTKSLPNSITAKPWSIISNSALTQARPVYITSDNIVNTSVDTARSNSIVNGLIALGLTSVNWGLGPNTHYAVLQNSTVPANALIIDIYGGACAGTIYEMGLNYYKQLVGSKKVFCVWIPPSVDITGLAWLPRAHDDNFSPANFTGLAHPDQYLLNNGYEYIYSGDLNTIISAVYNEAIT